MTGAEVRAAIDASLGTVDFVPPMSAAYCARVRDDLRQRLEDGALIDVYHRGGRELVVEVRAGDAACVVYSLALT